MATILQSFEIVKDDPEYKVKYIQALTIKPAPFSIRVRLRRGRSATHFAKELHSSGQSLGKQMETDTTSSTTLEFTGIEQKITILYASNAGTSEALANRLMSMTAAWGFIPRKANLKGFAGKLPMDEPVVLITASYNGEPAGDAVDFVRWLQGAKCDALRGVRFAVFGCGELGNEIPSLSLPRSHARPQGTAIGLRPFLPYPNSLIRVW